MSELNIQLHPYQVQAKEFIKSRPYCGLFLDMGLGKTLITLSALYDLNPKGHVLVIAPKNIARSTWFDEIEKWNIPIRTKSLIVDEEGKGLKKEDRLKLYEEVLNDPPTMYFINRELVVDLVKNRPKVEGEKVWPYPNVVIDEMQSFKTYNSKRFKALQKVRPNIERLIGLTGTPTPNGLMDLWSQIYLMDEGTRLGRNITAYRESFFRPGLHINGYPVEWIPLHWSEDEIHKRISDLVISIKNTNLKLPKCTFNNVFVHMDDKEMAMYNKLMKTSVLEIGDEQVTAVNTAVLTAKLSQMASGALYVNENHDYEIIHERKLEQCEYIIRNTGSPVIVAYHFKSDLKMIKDYLIKMGHDAQKFDGSPEMIHKWNRGEVPVMLIQPASAGHGLNLQDGGHTLIWYTIPWSLESYLQTNARLHRQGQKNPVVIHHLMTKGTIDRRILKAIDKKDTSQKALLEAVRITIDQTDEHEW